MAIVLKSRCEELKGTCERPQFPSWVWRFNRNQHMTHYTPWQIREEQRPPHYRNMGMHRDFRFHPNGPSDGKPPLIQLGVNICHNLIADRQAGFGNSALGRTPGPAPPRLLAYSPPSGDYQMDDFYTINEIHLISPGMSLHNYQPLLRKMSDDHSQPLNPSHYLEKTVGQVAEIPGTFPHFNKPLPTTSMQPARICEMKESTGCGKTVDLMERWRARHNQQLQRQAWERCCFQEPRYFPESGENSHRLPRIGGDVRGCMTSRR